MTYVRKWPSPVYVLSSLWHDPTPPLNGEFIIIPCVWVWSRHRVHGFSALPAMQHPPTPPPPNHLSLPTHPLSLPLPLPLSLPPSPSLPTPPLFVPWKAGGGSKIKATIKFLEQYSFYNQLLFNLIT
jgi:hypothetical protein